MKENIISKSVMKKRNGGQSKQLPERSRASSFVTWETMLKI